MIDIVYSECELSIAANKIERYNEELAAAMEQYCNILAEVQRTEAIKDDKICANLSEMAREVTTAKKLLSNEFFDLSDKVQKAITRIEKEDDFKFPSDFVSTLNNLLSSFL